MTRRLAPAVLLVLAGLGCGSRRAATVSPQTLNDALVQFLNAVKANDITRMGNLWGSDRGPASTYMSGDRLKKTLQTIHVYWDHEGYRIIEGPMPARPLNPTYKNVPSADRLRDFRVELQRANGCVIVIPITLVRTNQGSWLVYDVHFESGGNPAVPCQPASGTGTKP